MKILFASLATLALGASGVRAAELVNVAAASGVALGGYDPVAFFTDARPVHGSPSISATYQGASYFFATEEHRERFTKDPGSFVPQCGGFCAYGVSVGALFPVDIDTWQIRNGKLYLNLNPQILQAFNAELDSNIAKAAQKWPELVKKHAR